MLDKFFTNSENRNEGSTMNHSITIIRPKSFADTNTVCSYIKANNIVTFSLENLPSDEGQRLLDYISGATFVMDATLNRVTDKVYTSVPAGYEIEELD